MPLDVELPHRLAERVLHEGHPALPASPHLGHPGEGAAVEVEVLLHEGSREVGRALVDEVPGQPVTPCLDRLLLQG